MAQVKVDQVEERSAFISDRQSRFVPSPRRVRVFFNHQVIADSQNTMLLLEWRRSPVYYFPEEDVEKGFLVESDHRERRPSIGESVHWHVEAGGQRAEDAAWHYPEPKDDAPPLAGYIAFDWHQMDAWFEEDEEVFVHARDPYVRIDTLHSSRHVRVVVEGEVVAETHRPVLLFETGLITRYYLPIMDVRTDLLRPSDTHTECPYKGVASYHSVQVGDQVHEDIVWHYPFPNLEVSKIQNLVSFYNERVDIYVDGVLQARPRHPFR